MIRAAAWILEQESRVIHSIAPDADPTDVMWMHMALMGGSAPVWGMVAMGPYWQISQSAAAADWVVRDIAHTARTGRVRGAYTLYPRTFRFASRGGWRFVATRVGSKFLGPVGVALLMYDAWKTGIWIGEKLFGEMD